MTDGRAWLIRGGLLVAVLTTALAAGEATARLAGLAPWSVDALGIVVKPGGRFFEADPKLGYRHLPGRFKVRLHTGYTFVATHGPDTLRVTGPPRAARRRKGPIWIFGCSITYGWSVNDWETYPWLLQARLPDRDVVNFGVNGYGTLHSLLQFREALERGGRPDLVVLAYAQIHDERNTFTRNRRKTIAPWNRLGPLVQPYARLDDEGHLQVAMAELEYREFPLMRWSALSHLLEVLYNRFESRLVRSRQATLGIIEEFAAVSERHGIPLLVAGVRPAQLGPVLEWVRDRGIPAADISVNNRDPRYRNLPHDGHPSALAHAEYADRLYAVLTELGFGRTNGASPSDLDR